MVDLSGVFGAALAAIYDDAILYEPAEDQDDGTGTITHGEPTPYGCDVQIEAATLTMRGAEDFVATDVRVLILTATVAVTPPIGAVLAVTSGRHAGERYRLLSRDVDPGSAAWDMRGRLLR
jgi:hypothetical protein